MKFYIGLGGIGCKTLLQYQKLHEQDADKKFYYVDTDPMTREIAKNVYILPNAANGTGTRRYAGRNIVNYEIYNGSMSEFFMDIKRAEQVELIFSLSSFGGFGGAAIIPLIAGVSVRNITGRERIPHTKNWMQDIFTPSALGAK